MAFVPTKVVQTTSELEATSADITDTSTFDRRVFGYRLGVGGTRRVISSTGTLNFFPDDFSQQITVSSSDSADESTGLGVQTLTITGLSTTGARLSETITMNGTTNVTTINSFSAVNQLRAATTGGNRRNSGDITIVSPSSTGLEISATEVSLSSTLQAGVSNGLIYAVPNGSSAYILGVEFDISNVTQNSTVKVSGYMTQTDVANSPVQRIFGNNFLFPNINDTDSATHTETLTLPIKIPENHTWWFDCSTSAGNFDIEGSVIQTIRSTS